MKILIHFLVLFIFIVSVVGCKSDNAAADIANTDPTVPAQVPDAPEDIEVIFPDSIFNNHIWKVQTILENGQVAPSSKYNASELQLLSNGTFTWTGKEINHSGSYSFNQEKNLLQLNGKSDDQSSEWTVKNRRRFMVLIGTATYDQSNLQMSLVR